MPIVIVVVLLYIIISFKFAIKFFLGSFLDMNYKELKQQFPNPIKSFRTSGSINFFGFRGPFLKIDLYPSHLIVSVLNLATIIDYKEPIELENGILFATFRLKRNGNKLYFPISSQNFKFLEPIIQSNNKIYNNEIEGTLDH